MLIDENGKPAEAEARRGQSADRSPRVLRLVTCLQLCGEAGIFPCTCNMQVLYAPNYMRVRKSRSNGLEHCCDELRPGAENCGDQRPTYSP
jgi:hypothetical protein